MCYNKSMKGDDLMEVKTNSAFIALLASIVAIGILAVSSLLIVVPLFYLLAQAGSIPSCSKSFLILWGIITFLRSIIPSRKNHTISIKL